MGSARTRRLTTALAAFAATTVLAAPAALAQEAGPTLGPVPSFDHCPPTATGCAEIVVRSGGVDFNGFKVPITDGAVTIQGGLQGLTFKPITAGDYGITAAPLTVPGGVFGIDLPFNNLLGLTAAKARLDAVAPPEVNFLGPEVVLKTRFQVINPLVGDSCYIGSKDFPVTLDLTSQEDLGSILNRASTFGDPTRDTLGIAAVTTSATSFPLPPAQGCGPFGVLDPIVNLRAHVPSDGTGNTLTTTADVYLDNGPLPTPTDATTTQQLRTAATR